MPSSVPAPDLSDSSYTVLGRDLFVLGYRFRFDNTDELGGVKVEATNEFWQLTYDADGRLIWVNLSIANKAKTPSPIFRHVMFAYGNNVCSFGGRGKELLQYNVLTKKWSDVVSTGDIPPSPDIYYVCTRIRGTVYVYDLELRQSMYKLDLATLHWTKIETHSGPGISFGCSFTAIDCHRIAVYGGHKPFPFPGPVTGDIWLFDVTSNTWTQNAASGPPRELHSVVKHPHSDALLVFGGIAVHDFFPPFTTIQLSSKPEKQPKSLLQLALKAVDLHRDRTGLSGIPVDLQKKLLHPGEKISMDDEDEVQ
jgi:YD repeat-containing protein